MFKPDGDPVTVSAIAHQAPEKTATGHAQDQPMLQIQNITKTFAGTLAVDHVSLDLPKGEIFALLGASGSGKSTLLRMLAGFEKPTSGRIILAGQDITDLPPYERPINMMFQSYALFPHMTVEQNIAYGLKQDNLPKQEISARVNEMLTLVHMTQFARRKPHQLSGGQRQRVALARSLAKQPQLLLLDEPMGALDKKLRTRMQLELVEIIEQVGVTCLMVTHDQEEAMTMAHRIAIMDTGWIVQVGTPTDIYETPNSRMAAEFIGSINMFAGQITRDEADHVVIESQLLNAPVHIGHGIATALENPEVWIAIRPEKTRITREKPVTDCNWSSGVIDDIAYLGTHSVYYIRLDSGKMVQANMANTQRHGERPAWNDQVYVSWDDSSPVVLNS